LPQGFLDLGAFVGNDDALPLDLPREMLAQDALDFRSSYTPALARSLRVIRATFIA
jgi:hypothetical protein